MKLIRLLLQNSVKDLFVAATASFISGASSAGIIAVINFAIANILDLPPWLPWLFIALCLVLWVFQFISWVLITRLSQEIIYDLRLSMTQRILDCPLQQVEVITTPKLLATLTGDINAIASASIQISLIVVNLAVLVGIFSYLFLLSPLLFLAVFVSIAGGFLLYNFLQAKGIKEFEKGRQIQDNLFKHFRSVTEGIKELKLHRSRRKSFIESELKLSATQAKHYWVKGVTAFAFAGSLGAVLFFVPIGLILFVLPKLNLVDIALISSCALAVLYMISPISEIATSLPQIAQANVSLTKIESLGLSLTEEVVEPANIDESRFNSSWTSLQLRDLNYAYGSETEEHQFNLHNINLNFQPGEIVFIVGGNGSGKSTLIKLLTGLYTPDRGRILFNKLTIDDNNREWYRQKFSAVFYDFYLFDRLIDIDASRQSKIDKYLTLLELEHKVTVKDGLLSTINLSQGQRKRLALLTAYIEDRPIYIFDEWASDQDPVFKRVFYKELLPELKAKGKTVIAVSHDDRYFTEGDRLIKLDYGRVVEETKPPDKSIL